ncbi:GNAT family N-acetyltransferase [Mycolicibacter sinensis]|jgi:RimJ/RimL family protein N-acetyltransferase|uniref:Lysine N-acyltransferase MbtK n=1 Tax=Mycolicibacter sinensis (strain JDM601) TaxID=875328 RepID=A0A1A2ECE5_MYCSD|nr:GNAT family N-acetyltransferase [Mycolicibacter sinensis]OBG02822.1 siderophore biosynthesis protein [Mycolicibacter sinensis]OBG09479.1 siderophore biosynthesis protein [Mycolicibacter sinensis]
MTDAAAILPRELTDISDEVRSVPAPPIPVLADPYAIRVADPDADAEMVAEWMSRPHLAQTWESAWPAARWHAYLSAQVAGSYSRPLIVSRNGEDGGYVEIYRGAKDCIATRYAAHPYDLGVHAAVADLAVVNRGFAAILLPRVMASVFDLEPQCRRMMFDPEYRNTAMRRLAEYVGGTFLGEHDMSNRRMALYAVLRYPDDPLSNSSA